MAVLGERHCGGDAVRGRDVSAYSGGCCGRARAVAGSSVGVRGALRAAATMPGGGVGSGGGAHGGAWAQAHDALRVDHLLLGQLRPLPGPGPQAHLGPVPRGSGGDGTSEGTANHTTPMSVRTRVFQSCGVDTVCLGKTQAKSRITPQTHRTGAPVNMP